MGRTSKRRVEAGKRRNMSRRAWRGDVDVREAEPERRVGEKGEVDVKGADPEKKIEAGGRDERQKVVHG